MPTVTVRPASTYRLQFHAGFTFRDATDVVDYLADLGITHVYASPYLRARPGSTHGYDVIDHQRLNPELGSDADFETFCEKLASRGMRQIVDIVPNHVGVATNDNEWWNDVLRHGRASKFAAFFDIEWDSPRPQLKDKVLLPLLGEPYASALEAGKLRLIRRHDGPWVEYYDRRFPIDPATLDGEAQAADEMHELLEKQHYRLAWWKTASDEINYRRFFDVNDLAAISMERSEVFEAAHARMFELIAAGHVTGLRLDHPDGLRDPAAYFRQLQQRFTELTGHTADDGKPLYLLAEKILAVGEPLPIEWKIDGTSGYEFLNQVNGLFIDRANEAAFTQLYQSFTGRTQSFADLAYEKKKLILNTALASEMHMLAVRLDRLAQRHRHWRDVTLRALQDALVEVIACFGVYRTYIDSPDVRPIDRERIDDALAAAKPRNATIDASTFGLIRAALLQEYPRSSSEDDRAAQLAFAARFQQLASPATAKGVEDTAFYIDQRLISLNEVGGDPARFGACADDVHAFFVDRQRHWPNAMSTLSTHDTKRSEDLRARLNALSHLPAEWDAHVRQLAAIAEPFAADIHGERAPSRNDEYQLFQTLLGVWPDGLTGPASPELLGRIQAFAQKSLREAKVFTKWTEPNQPFEAAVESYINRVLADSRFLAAFLPLQRRVAEAGRRLSMSQTLIKLTAPGVPDTYQGTECFDFSLVDPDNRRPVDYADRKSRLARGGDSADDRKLQLHRILLHVRKSSPDLFSRGEYVPLTVRGAHANRVFAFARVFGEQIAISVAALTADTEWHGTAIDLPKGWHGRKFENVLAEGAAQPIACDLATLLGPGPIAFFRSAVP